MDDEDDYVTMKHKKKLANGKVETVNKTEPSRKKGSSDTEPSVVKQKKNKTKERRRNESEAENIDGPLKKKRKQAADDRKGDKPKSKKKKELNEVLQATEITNQLSVKLQKTETKKSKGSRKQGDKTEKNDGTNDGASKEKKKKGGKAKKEEVEAQKEKSKELTDFLGSSDGKPDQNKNRQTVTENMKKDLKKNHSMSSQKVLSVPGIERSSHCTQDGVVSVPVLLPLGSDDPQQEAGQQSARGGVIEMVAATREAEKTLLGIDYSDHKKILVALDQSETSPWFQQVHI